MNKYIAKQAKSNFYHLQNHKDDSEHLKHNILKCYRRMNNTINKFGNMGFNSKAYGYLSFIKSIRNEANDNSIESALSNSLSIYKYIYYDSLGLTRHITIKNQPIKVISNHKRVKELINNEVIKDFGLGASYKVLHMDIIDSSDLNPSDTKSKNSDNKGKYGLGVTIVLK